MSEKPEDQQIDEEKKNLASLAAETAVDAHFANLLLLSFVGHLTSDLMEKGLIDSEKIAEKFKEVTDQLEPHLGKLSRGTKEVLERTISGELKS